MVSVVCIFFGAFLSAMAAADTLVVYPAPETIPANDAFTVQVRTQENPWRRLFIYAVQVDMHNPQRSSMAFFDFSGTAEVAVEYNQGDIQSARIRPLSYGIHPEIKGRTLLFKLQRPCNIAIEVNGNIFNNLHLFAGPVEPSKPDPNDPNTLFFGPGIHESASSIRLPSGKTVYLAGGAVVKSKLVCDSVENVRIAGRGVLYQPHRGIEITFSKNIEIDGICVINPSHYTVLGGQSQGITIRNLKSFSSRGWTDGIDLMSCSDVLIDGVFLRNSDDCIAVYGHRWDYFGDAQNITVQNAALWADVAHPVMIGTHGNPDSPEVIENITLKNIDILNHDEPQINYQGCIAMNASDENLIRNIRVEDVRIEDFQQGQLLNLRVTFNRKYAKAPGRGIENILFRNVSYAGQHANLSVISGYNEQRTVRGVVFENLTINGRLIWDQMPGKPAYFATSDKAGIFVGEHVEAVEFRTDAAVP